jgi:hypothetical protein
MTALDHTDWQSLIEAAHNPDCPSARLEQLYQQTEEMRQNQATLIRHQKQWEKVRQGIAQNPNTSPERLQALFTDEGEVPSYYFVLQNPAFSLILIESPDFFHHVDNRLLFRLLYRAQLPEFVWIWLQRHGHPHLLIQEAIRDRQQTEKDENLIS